MPLAETMMHGETTSLIFFDSSTRPRHVHFMHIQRIAVAVILLRA